MPEEARPTGWQHADERTQLALRGCREHGIEALVELLQVKQTGLTVCTVPQRYEIQWHGRRYKQEWCASVQYVRTRCAAHPRRSEGSATGWSHSSRAVTGQSEVPLVGGKTL